MSSSAQAAPIEVTNWFGDVVSHPKVIVDAESVDDIVAVVQDQVKYPSPVRAVGSNHSTTFCGVADGGTLIRMKMNRILRLAGTTLTVEAGATLFTMAKELEKNNLQFYVNAEIGSLTAGSAAIAGTKDSSMPGEYGQVGSYVTAVKMVLPNGELLEVTQDKDAALLQKVRCNYGTFGIVYEVTFQVRPLARLDVHHKTYSLSDFLAALPELVQLQYSMMFYMFPFEDKITVEFRRYNPNATGEPNRAAWYLRNQTWHVTGPKLGHDVEQNVADKTVRYSIIDHFNAVWRFQLENIVVSDNTIPTDQIIDYPPVSDVHRFTFSLFAFAEDGYAQTLTEFYQFCKDYYRDHGYRSNLLYVGYRIAKDQTSLLSHSFDGPVMTIDPVSTSNPGWSDYLLVFNEFCAARGGKPLLNQTFGLTPELAKRTLGERLETMIETRRQFDPNGRLLNDYFRGIMA